MLYIIIIYIKRIKVNNNDNITFEKKGGKFEVLKELSRSSIMNVGKTNGGIAFASYYIFS